MTGVSSGEQLLVSSQERVAGEGKTLEANCSTTVLKPPTGTSRSEAAYGLVISSFESTAENTRHNTPNPKPSIPGAPSKASANRNIGHRKRG